MSQRLLCHAFGVREGYEYRSTKYVEGRVEFHLRVEKKLLRCPDYGNATIHRRGGCTRRIRSVPIGLKETVLVVEVPQCYCPACQKTFEVSPPSLSSNSTLSMNQHAASPAFSAGTSAMNRFRTTRGGTQQPLTLDFSEAAQWKQQL